MEHNTKPNLELRHMRLHVSHEGAQYVVYARQHLAEGYLGCPIWSTFQHVIDDQGKSYAGAGLRLERDHIVLSVVIKSEDFEAALVRAEGTK